MTKKLTITKLSIIKLVKINNNSIKVKYSDVNLIIEVVDIEEVFKKRYGHRSDIYKDTVIDIIRRYQPIYITNIARYSGINMNTIYRIIKSIDEINYFNIRRLAKSSKFPLSFFFKKLKGTKYYYFDEDRALRFLVRKHRLPVEQVKRSVYKRALTNLLKASYMTDTLRDRLKSEILKKLDTHGLLL